MPVVVAVARGAAPAARLTWAQVRAWRLARQHLDRPAAAGSLVDVASRLCGAHAQLMSSAELTLWARIDSLPSGAVAQALWDERTLVKTWAMRGTLHLLPAAELPMWQAALSTYRHYERPAWLRAFGVRFTRPDHWLGGWRPVEPEEARREVARRFLAAHGPASRDDLGR